MTSPLAILAAIAVLAARVAAILKPNTLPSPEEEGAAQPALIAASGRETEALRRTCAPAYDSLQPTATGTGATGPALLLDEAVPVGGRPRVRACSESKAPVSDMKALVLPEYKLAFCYIPKVACSQFKDLFNHINGLPDQTLGFGHDYFHSMYWLQGLKMSDITRAKGWKFAAFTRDPALRYLSAYGDVCPMENVYPKHMLSCCGPLTSLTNSSAAEMVQDFKARVKLDVTIGRPDEDQHWASQVDVLESCGWESFRPDNLDYWGVLSGDVNAQVKEMLQVAGYDDAKVVDRFFPPHSTAAGHTGRLKGEPLDYISDLETLEGLVQLYADDYRLLPGVGCAFTEPLLAKLKATNASSH